MTAFLLTWNPGKWHWRDLRDDAALCRSQGFVDRRWSCGHSKRIQPKDRVFLLRQGVEPRGIIGSGWATSEPIEEEHWSTRSEDRGKTARYIDVHFDILLDADREPIFSRAWLNDPQFSGMHWDTQMSGIRIKEGVEQQLEREWTRFLAGIGIVQEHIAQRDETLPEELDEKEQYVEGALQRVTINRFERNSLARRQCIQHHGLDCTTCGINFEDVYGDLGVGFIHVHHLTPLAQIGETYEVDPVRDLAPVCPNCHAMLHRAMQNGRSRSIHELRGILAGRASPGHPSTER